MSDLTLSFQDALWSQQMLALAPCRVWLDSSGCLLSGHRCHHLGFFFFLSNVDFSILCQTRYEEF